ncbi:hypothetical protein L596_029133 [Steinernema carpocapsae]|uniref:Uncharacterized protein n=1 Tax=Steinernema carpocapsae TaxID=34508 RepID=A0A4U5LTS0_STECR|nr:hypothetical protein L596_029133 [Steinernema carpocapsae]
MLRSVSKTTSFPVPNRPNQRSRDADLRTKPKETHGRFTPIDFFRRSQRFHAEQVLRSMHTTHNLTVFEWHFVPCLGIDKQPFRIISGFCFDSNLGSV